MADTPLSGKDPEALRHELQGYLNSLANRMLVCLVRHGYRASGPVVTQEHDGLHRVAVTLTRADQSIPCTYQPLPFRLFSDKEEKVIKHLREHNNTPATRDALAEVLWGRARANAADTALFGNLEDRGVVEEPREGKGIRLTAVYLAFAQSPAPAAEQNSRPA